MSGTSNASGSRPRMSGALPATLLAGAAVAATALATRRWARAEDPTGGVPLCLPEGEDRTVVTGDGARLATRVAGNPDGTTIVLLHGWTSDRRVWGCVARRLVEAGHRVVLYDHRGHGRSTVGAGGMTIEALAADLRAVLEEVDARDAVVAGHSMGGMTAQVFAVEQPDALAERVARLVLVSTGCDRLGYGGAVDRFLSRAAGGRVPDLGLAVAPLAPLFVRWTVGRTPCLPHLRAVGEMFVATPRASRARFLAAIHGLDLSERLSVLRVPVQIVVGRRDRLTPLGRSRRLAELLPHADLLIFDDAGHMLPLEVPGELTALLDGAAREAGAARRSRMEDAR